MSRATKTPPQRLILKRINKLYTHILKGKTMELEEIFETNLQVRLIKIFLENPNELFSTRTLARKLSSSPSSIIPRLRRLTELGVVKTIGVNRLKLYQLNQNKLAEILLQFYRQLKKINSQPNPQQ